MQILFAFKTNVVRRDNFVILNIILSFSRQRSTNFCITSIPASQETDFLSIRNTNRLDNQGNSRCLFWR